MRRGLMFALLLPRLLQEDEEQQFIVIGPPEPEPSESDVTRGDWRDIGAGEHALFLYEDVAIDAARAGVRSEVVTGAVEADLIGYERSAGLFPGRHYRRKYGDGCFHARVYRDVVYLHFDNWDPARFPVRHWLEVGTGFIDGIRALWSNRNA